jgi:hypothetical protein
MKKSFTCFATLWLLGASLLQAPAQGTAFTYQGVLTDNGAPANSAYDLEFSCLQHAQRREPAREHRHGQ